MVFDHQGELVRSWHADVSDAHGMTMAKDGDQEVLWVADNGRKRQADLEYGYPNDTVQGQVLKMDLHGNVLMSIQRPDLEVYREGVYSPTFIVVNEERLGGNGDVWVADGYGQSYVHRYDKLGN